MWYCPCIFVERLHSSLHFLLILFLCTLTVITFSDYKLFGLVEIGHGPDENTIVGRAWEASSAILLTTLGISFCGLSLGICMKIEA
jgi:hypothetical protein